MLATTPTGSRRIMEVKPSIYSPAAMPLMFRTAPAIKRNRSTQAPISSRAASKGLPVSRDSILAKSLISASRRLATSSKRPERSPGVLAAKLSKASVDALTAASTCSGVASLISQITSPVAGFSTGTAVPAPSIFSPLIRNSLLISITLSPFVHFT